MNKTPEEKLKLINKTTVNTTLIHNGHSFKKNTARNTACQFQITTDAINCPVGLDSQCIGHPSSVLFSATQFHDKPVW